MQKILKETVEGFWNNTNKSKYENAMEKVIGEIYRLDQIYCEKMGCHFIRFVEKRLKSADSMYLKIQEKGKKAEGKTIEEVLGDLAGVRIICYDIEQIYAIASMVKKSDDFHILKEKDYVHKPKASGYQSYHILLQVADCKVEVQLRTILMDAWSSLDRLVVYKKTKPVSDELKADIHNFFKWSRKMDKMVHKILRENRERELI